MGFAKIKLRSLRNFLSEYKWTFVSTSVIALIAGGISWWAKLNFWLIFLMMLGSVWINGIIATLEDDMPGGFNNPDDTDPPPPKKKTIGDWILWGIFALVIGFCVWVFVWGERLI